MLSGFFSKNQSFEDAIAKHRNSSITYVPKIAKGLPFYTTKTLTPTWEENRAVTIPKFSLVDQTGAIVDESLFRNKVSIVSFIFTSCAGFCPLLVNKLKILRSEISKNNDVQIVVITVDPEVDTSDRLLQYAKSHSLDSNWVLLTGSKQAVYNLSRSTFASEIRKIESENMRKFAHTEHFYVIDQKLRIRDILNGTRKDIYQQGTKTVAILSQSIKK